MDSQTATVRPPLPVLDLPIRILRAERRLELGTGEIYTGPRTPGDLRPRVVQWRVEGGMMPDELVLVFGRPIDWTGPVCVRKPDLPLAEGCLGGPVMLSRRTPSFVSQEPSIPDVLTRDEQVGWCFGAVLMRGEDRPWFEQSILTIRRARIA